MFFVEKYRYDCPQCKYRYVSDTTMGSISCPNDHTELVESKRNSKEPARCEVCAVEVEWDKKVCENCWEVETRLADYLKSPKGRKTVHHLLLARMPKRGTLGFDILQFLFFHPRSSSKEIAQKLPRLKHLGAESARTSVSSCMSRLFREELVIRDESTTPWKYSLS